MIKFSVGGIWQLVIGTVGAAALGIACSETGNLDDQLGVDGEMSVVDELSGDELSGDELSGDSEIGTLEQPLCENKGGTNTVMTAIAVAAGRELRRWKPETDFRWNSSTGRLELTSTGSARCGGLCSNTQALLDMQKPEAHRQVSFPGNILLDVPLLKQKLDTAWRDQAACNSSGACTVPAHDLRFHHVENGSCDKKYFFDPLKEGSGTWLSEASATTLSRKLKFVGYPTNKMLNFYLRDGRVSVDPTYGLNEGGTTTSGSCDVACTKFSKSDANGKCCSCNGATRKYARSTFSSWIYLCK